MSTILIVEDDVKATRELLQAHWGMVTASPLWNHLYQNAAGY